MKRKYIIILSALIIIFYSIPPVLTKQKNDLGPIRKKLYLRKKTSVYPSIGNDIKIKIKNQSREVIGLLSKNGNKLVILFHGNGSIINDFEFIAKIFYKNGYSTLLIEYPGYGLSYKYKPTEKNIYSDCDIIINYVQNKYNYKKNNTYLFGWSLGAAVAVEMIKRKLGSKLIIVSAFTSAPDVAHEKYVKVLPYFFMIDRYSNKMKARFINEPVMIIHGTSDRLVPYKMSIKLNKLFPNSDLISIKNADHVNIFKFVNDKIWNKIFKFLK